MQLYLIEVQIYIFNLETRISQIYISNTDIRISVRDTCILNVDI